MLRNFRGFFSKSSLRLKLLWGILIGACLLGVSMWIFYTALLQKTFRNNLYSFVENMGENLDFALASSMMEQNYPVLDRFVFSLKDRFHLIDIEKAVILSPDKTVMASLEPEEFLRKIPANLGANRSIDIERDGEVFHVKAVLPIQYGGTPVGSLFLEANSKLTGKRMLLVQLYGAGLILVLVSILAFLMYTAAEQVLLEPLESLTLRTREIASGVSKNDIPKERDDEIGILVDSINQMKNELIRENERHQVLLENSREIRMNLDPDFNIIYINKAVRTFLGYLPGQLMGMPFHGFLNISDENLYRQYQVFREEAESGREHITGIFEFKKALSHAGIMMKVDLERIEYRDEFFYAGVLMPVESPLGKYIKDEQVVMEIPNDFTIAEEAVKFITEQVRDKLNARQLANVQVSLKEMLVNAIEHGNLEIDFETKSSAHLTEDYHQFLQERLAEPQYQDRRVRIEFLLQSDSFVVCIEDEGKGFDHEQFRSEVKERVNHEMRTHGRGIIMSEAVFDEMQYNEKGNQVTLRKKFTK